MSNSWEIKIKRQEVAIKNVLNNFISLEVYDRFIKKTTISYVRISNDFSLLKIYINAYEKEKFDKIIKRFNDCKGLFKTVLAREINFKKVPDIVFLKDETEDRVAEIEEIFQKIKEEKNER